MELTGTNRPCGLTVLFLRQTLRVPPEVRATSSWHRKVHYKYSVDMGCMRNWPLAGKRMDSWRRHIACGVFQRGNYKCCLRRLKIHGDIVEEVIPDPIPNSEVKLFRADGTAWETVWESRTSPG